MRRETIVTNGKNETVTTWADGFGIWHARVRFPAPGYTPDELAESVDRLRRKARRAIRRALTERHAPTPLRPTRVELHEKDEALGGELVRSLTYREVEY